MTFKPKKLGKIRIIKPSKIQLMHAQSQNHLQERIMIISVTSTHFYKVIKYHYRKIT